MAMMPVFVVLKSRRSVNPTSPKSTSFTCDDLAPSIQPTYSKSRMHLAPSLQHSYHARNTMSTTTPSYLEDRLSNIRTRPLPWEGYQRSGLLSETELAKIKTVDKTSREKKAALVRDDARGYAELILGAENGGEIGVLKKAGKRNDVVQYALVLMVDLLGRNERPEGCGVACGANG